jgi:hypothetical protein
MAYLVRRTSQHGTITFGDVFSSSASPTEFELANHQEILARSTCDVLTRGKQREGYKCKQCMDGGFSLSEADFESNNGPGLGFIELSPAFLAHPFLDL